jgi:hypothetical protein
MFGVGSMTGQEFLRWLEQCSMDALRAIERLADLNSNSSTRSALPAEPQDPATVRRSAYGTSYGEH